MSNTLFMRARARFPVAVILLLVCCACAFSLDPSLDVSQYAHKAWRVRDGFTKGSIFSIAQTHDGYLWLGTELGLVRFDGVRAIPWQPPAGQQLPSERIGALLVSRDDTLWIGTWKGLASWKNGKLTAYPELSEQHVAALLEDREGTVWVGSLGTPPPGRLCSIRGGSLQCHGEDGSLGPGAGVVDLFEDSKGNLWVGVLNGCWRWKPGSSELISVPGAPDGVRFGEDEGGLIVTDQTGLKRLKSGHIEPFVVSGLVQPFTVYRMLRDRDGALWIATHQIGIVHVHQGKADVFSQSDTLTSNVALNLMQDREGNVWVPTTDGLDQFRPYSIPTISAKQGLSNTPAFSVVAAKDSSVWIGTSNGLNRWERGQISVFGRAASQKSGGKLNGLVPTSIFQDSEARLWVAGTHEFGYVENDRFVPVTALPFGVVHSIAELPAGHLWIAYEDAGLFHLFQGRVVQQIPWAGLGHKDAVTVLLADPSQRGLWLGFFQGGVAYFADGGIREYYSSGNGLGEGIVSDLRFGPRGALWVATEGGLSRIKDGKVATLTSKNGLPCDSVLWTMEDDDHAFWLSMRCGLVRLAKSELDAWVADPNKVLSISLFDTTDGVRSLNIAGGFTPQVAKSPDGRIWFTAYDGISVIDPHNLPVNKLPPPVRIEQVTADRKTFDASNGLRLPPHVRDLEIDYTALSFVAPEKVRFRYKLEGLDRDWQHAGSRRQAFYTNLAPRNYRFRVMACNNSGVWNEAGTFLDFSIAPAYYQTIWFRLSCAIAFLALLWMAFEMRVRHLHRQFNVRLEERVNERTRIARDLHDTLLQSFQGVLMKFEVARDMLPERVAESQSLLDATTEQARKAIIEGREVVQGLRSSTVTTNELARAIGILAEELAAASPDANCCDFHLLVEGTTRDIVPIIRDEIYRIASEALRNAFKHAHARRIEVELCYDPRNFRLRIWDDGRGIDPNILAHGGSSHHYGLPGMKERARLVKGKLTVLSKPDSGTEIELSIPGSAAYVKSTTARRPLFFRKEA